MYSQAVITVMVEEALICRFFYISFIHSIPLQMLTHPSCPYTSCLQMCKDIFQPEMNLKIRPHFCDIQRNTFVTSKESLIRLIVAV